MKNIRKKPKTLLRAFVLGILLFAISGISYADEGHDFSEGKELVESKIQCDQLNEEQLEEIGEYLMEVMHPGEGHEVMHQLMGLEEGTDTEEQFHINIAKRMYCNEGSGMMGMMSNKGGMMNGGMGMMGSNMMGSGMMGSGTSFMMGYNSGYWSFLNLLYLLLLIGLVVLVYLWIIKLWKTLKGKDTKK